ncbi:hypothetical protein [Cellulomonas sp. PhB143]|uniref:hypothetical protein n=1 Tax=Cellulomonas sp. PhB143 TaxID=2485186 RepID=UPI000F47A534|nr:hypothetical protein [Cellulomonas sp. PhB143]ROS78716.1 hypothetical protein EDF32_0621 [Cellulomonas sp. PhB143]
MDDDAPQEDRGSARVVVARALLVLGRVLPVVTIAVLVWSHKTQDAWGTAPLDESGFTTAWLPGLAGVLLFATCLVLPVILLPVGSSALAVREGGRLSVPTVLGRRTVELAGVATWRAMLPGRGSDTHLVLLRSRRGWAILSGSNLWFDDGFRMLDDHDFQRSGRHERLRLAARGWLLIVLWMPMFFVLFGLGLELAGTV